MGVGINLQLSQKIDFAKQDPSRQKSQGIKGIVF